MLVSAWLSVTTAQRLSESSNSFCSVFSILAVVCRLFFLGISALVAADVGDALWWDTSTAKAEMATACQRPPDPFCGERKGWQVCVQTHGVLQK